MFLRDDVIAPDIIVRDVRLYWPIRERLNSFHELWYVRYATGGCFKLELLLISYVRLISTSRMTEMWGGTMIFCGVKTLRAAIYQRLNALSMKLSEAAWTIWYHIHRM